MKKKPVKTIDKIYVYAVFFFLKKKKYKLSENNCRTPFEERKTVF